MKALSIRQPWAWLILNGGKDIENRSRRTHFRGRVLIHASGYRNRFYDEEVSKYVSLEIKRDVLIPTFEDLQYGGIIGSVEIVDCVDHSESPWFSGPYAYVLRNPEPMEFIPCKGALGFFTPKI